MAELVHQRTELMLNELEQLQRTKLFTTSEVKAIIRKRTKHEYKLVRRSKRKKDFLGYLQYEVNLLSLIQKRRDREQYYFKNDEIEYAIISRIHRIFKQAVKFWASDLQMWISHANFCIKWKKRVQLSKLCTRFLQIHGHKPEMWVLAAKWEIECCNSMENGRLLFVRGLKRHPKSKKLWLELFRAELMFAEKLRRRIKMLLPSDIEVEHVGESEERLLQGAAALIAYRNAIGSVAEDPCFHVKFLSVASCFLETSSFARKIVNTIRDDLVLTYPRVPVVLSELAKLHLNVHFEDNSQRRFGNSDKLRRLAEQACFREFDQAVCDVSTDEMWGYYVDCLLSLCADDQAGVLAVLGENPVSSAQQRLSKALGVVASAHQKRKLTTDRYSSITDFLLKHGRIDLARKLLNEITKDREDPELMLKKIEVCLSIAVQSRINWKPEKLFLKTSKKTSGMTNTQQRLFWRRWMEYAIIEDKKELAKEIATTFSSHAPSDVTSAMLDIYLKWLAANSGIKAAFQIFMQDICRLRTPSLEQFLHMIDTCQSLPDDDVIEECFDLALKSYGRSSVDLWMKCIEHCQKRGKKKASQIGMIYWRAKHTLNSSLIEELMSRYALLGFSQPQ